MLMMMMMFGFTRRRGEGCSRSSGGCLLPCIEILCIFLDDKFDNSVPLMIVGDGDDVRKS